MELRVLKYFVTVAKQLSFSRAAESLFVSQSSLSKQIAGLEAELGTQLFVRTGRSIELTNAGQKLLQGADEMLRMEEDLVLQIKELGTGLPVRHSLTISLEEAVTANDDVCSHIIAVAQTLKRHYAPLELVFKYENKPVTGSLDNAESADVFFCVSNEKLWSKEYDCQLLSKDRFVLAGAGSILGGETDVRTLLRSYPLLMLENEGRGVMDISKILYQLDVRPEIRFSKSNLTIALDLATEVGLAIVPEKKAKTLANTGVSYVEIPGGTTEVSLFAVYERNVRNPMIHPFLDALTVRL